MPRTYEDIFKDYSAYSSRTTKLGTGVQLGLAGAQLAAGPLINRNYDYDPPKKLQARTVSLSTTDVKSGAMLALNRAFNSMISGSKERGDKINPALLAKYTEAVGEVEKEQVRVNKETRNEQEKLNFAAASRADEVNANQAGRDAQMESQMSIYKAQQMNKTLDAVSLMGANVINMKKTDDANRLNAELGIKPLADIELATTKASALATQKAGEEKRFAGILEESRLEDIRTQKEMDADLEAQIDANLDEPFTGRDYWKPVTTPKLAPKTEFGNVTDKTGNTIFAPPDTTMPKAPGLANIGLTGIEKYTARSQPFGTFVDPNIQPITAPEMDMTPGFDKRLGFTHENVRTTDPDVTNRMGDIIEETEPAVFDPFKPILLQRPKKQRWQPNPAFPQPYKPLFNLNSF